MIETLLNVADLQACTIDIMKKNSRFIAITTLVKLDQGSTPLPILFQRICAHHQVVGNDRALAMNLIYGVLRQYQYLDNIICRLSRTPLKKMHPTVHQGLAVGFYQILFLDRIPHSAAVNETVQAIRAAKLPKRLCGFVNGILREGLRQLNQLPRPDESLQKQRLLNHPDWLTSRWAKHFGDDSMVEICRLNNCQQPLNLRINPLKKTRQQYLDVCKTRCIEAISGRYGNQTVVLPDYQGTVSALPGYEEKWFQVQGEAAQLVTLLFQPFQRYGHYLDGCAGLGGKTGHLLELLAPYGAKLSAVEPEPHRREGLADTHGKAIDNGSLALYGESLQQFSTNSSLSFDGILLDVPCSGTGVIGRQPDIRWRRKAKEIAQYASTQQLLLATAAKMIKPGGTLVYATCSLEPEENYDVIHSFLTTAPDFILEDCTPYLPDNATSLVRNGCFHPLPTDGLDGFFGARLVRPIASD